MRRQRRKKEPMEIDITSLLDILVIMLVFLLKSYNASDLKLDVAKGIQLAKSQSTTLGNHAVIVQISQKQEVWVNNKSLGSDEKFEKLNNELKAVALTLNKEAKTPKKEHENMINVVFDQELAYSEVKNVMKIASVNGFNNFKFIVKGEE
jgi:biopolymer transport protein ExbD